MGILDMFDATSCGIRTSLRGVMARGRSFPENSNPLNSGRSFSHSGQSA